MSHVTRHTSHVTRHTSHATRHTSHVTRHTSYVLPAGLVLLQIKMLDDNLHSKHDTTHALEYTHTRTHRQMRTHTQTHTHTHTHTHTQAACALTACRHGLQWTQKTVPSIPFSQPVSGSKSPFPGDIALRDVAGLWMEGVDDPVTRHRVEFGRWGRGGGKGCVCFVVHVFGGD